MAKQRTDWGEILWLDENKEILSIQGMHVGIVSLFSGAHQPRHIHYDEQVIYVIQGQAVSIIDGESFSLKPGTFFHWKSGVNHEIFNIGNVPFQHLLISNPVSEDTEYFFPERENRAVRQVSPDMIYVAVEAIRTQFLERMHYGYTIFDSLGNLILQSQFFPEYCAACCQPGNNQGNCCCMRQLPPEEWKNEKVFHCRYGMEIFHNPIFFGGSFLGYIQSGYIRHSGFQGAWEDNETGAMENVYDVPESVVSGIRALMKRIVKAVTNYCEFEEFRKELMEKELRISSFEESQRILAKNLKETQTAVSDLKINNHFLFNTLNSMASMALDGGVMPLYQSIVDLSKMFHYTLRTQNSVVSLEKEVEYVKAYLQLQKLRYEEELEVHWRIDKAALSCQVPFNFLQPVVENAFIHGFGESIHKKIRILIRKKEGWLEVKVMNSGTRLTEQQCYAINQGITGNTSHGLSIIYQKLRAVYDENCALKACFEKNGETCFMIQIPFAEAEKAEERRLL